MTQFASKTPRDLNHDWFPYQSIQSAAVGFDYRVNEASLIARPEQRRGYTFNPRPEFDHVQHNEPNPILVAFRQDVHSRNEDAYWGDTYDSTMDWLDHAGESDHFCRARGITNAHIDHARKVLTRLANINN